MSILSKCIRFSWEAVNSLDHNWQGANDGRVEGAVRNKCLITSDYKHPVAETSKEFLQMAVPILLVLRNTQHPSIQERNFYWDMNKNLEKYYPTDWGTFLTHQERDKISNQLGIKKEHKFLLFLSESDDQEASFLSRVTMTHAFTTYTTPYMLSLDELSTKINEGVRGGHEQLLAEVTQTPLLVLTDVFGSCDRISFASGSLANIFRERMYNGRTTIFTDSGKIKYPKIGVEKLPRSITSLGPINRLNIESYIRDEADGVSINRTQLHRYFLGGMTYVMDTMSFSKLGHTCIE